MKKTKLYGHGREFDHLFYIATATATVNIHENNHFKKRIKKSKKLLKMARGKK